MHPLRSLRRRFRGAHRRLRAARTVAKALASTRHPVLAQIVPIRRCNLACTYCNEFDAVSAPVPTDVMLGRIDRLAALGTTAVDLSGGEPLLHPDVAIIVDRIRRDGMMAGLLTNGYLLTPARIEALNRAGLDRLQLSIDNLVPDDVSRKSLRVLEKRLRALAALAEFDVNVNTVLGGGLRNPDDVLAVARHARKLGFSATLGLIHDGSGQMVALGAAERLVYEGFARLPKPFYSVAADHLFQRNLSRGLANDWRCRAGSRYLYVCEDGLVHWCSQQRGCPAIPLERYSPIDLEREYHTVKACTPFCTVSCVHRVALVDELRSRPAETLQALFAAVQENDGRVPATVKVLTWMFVTGSQRALFRSAARRLWP